MSDLISIGATADNAAGSADVRLGTALDTGALRRKYNFGDRVSELMISQDPFFRFLSKVAKKSTNDPQFKFTERRGSWHKRYAYPVTHGVNASVATTDATVAATYLSDGKTYYFKMGTDYKSAGNIQNIYGQSNGAFSIGATGTQPKFFLPGQVLKFNYRGENASSAFTTPTGYVLVKVISVDLTSTATYAILRTEVIKGVDTAQDLMFASATAAQTTTYSSVIQNDLEPKRTYVVGSVYDKGTGYPETWADQPFSTAQGQTQIWKTTMAMDNTDRATELRYEKNEWARIWKDKLIEHKWDIEQSCLFGHFDTTYRTTEGAVDFITNYGNVFSLTHSTKTADEFLDDLSSYLDPRYNNGKATIFFCDTATFNWMHKIGGDSYFANNVGSIKDSSTVLGHANVDIRLAGKKKVFGVDVTVISTVYGDMNLVRNVHLDGSSVKILAINMNYVKYRPLVGNGINRDTSVYVGVQTLENSGVDRRVDLIQTEAGMEFSMPECHAYWA